MNTKTFAPALENTEAVTAFAEDALRLENCPEKAVRKLCVAADELFSNIARYGGATEFTLACQARDGRATMVFRDNGAAFDPTAAEPPDTGLDAAERPIGGLGIWMVRKMTTGMTYERRDGWNEVTVWLDV